MTSAFGALDYEKGNKSGPAEVHLINRNYAQGKQRQIDDYALWRRGRHGADDRAHS